MPQQRRSIRLQNYDYRSAGAYFVTICVKARQHPVGFACAAGGKGPPGPLHPRPGATPLGTPNVREVPG
ncbi:MAG: hypothetical protein MUD01_27020, partial [Chloroflexaceae bacterium]|nr:hypothetical protein [Chloroflexaceae bacterium]